MEVRRRAEKDGIKILYAFSNWILEPENEKKFQKITKDRARFYVNLIVKRSNRKTKNARQKP